VCNDTLQGHGIQVPPDVLHLPFELLRSGADEFGIERIGIQRIRRHDAVIRQYREGCPPTVVQRTQCTYEPDALGGFDETLCSAPDAQLGWQSLEGSVGMTIVVLNVHCPCCGGHVLCRHWRPDSRPRTRRSSFHTVRARYSRQLRSLLPSCLTRANARCWCRKNWLQGSNHTRACACSRRSHPGREQCTSFGGSTAMRWASTESRSSSSTICR